MKGKSRRPSSKRTQREQRILEKIHLNAAGIDIGSESHWVAVPDDRDEQPVREFKSFTHELIALADWLEGAASAPSPWSPRASTGFRSTRSSKSAASRCSS